ncbi:MAG: helix-turn-helix domain-containing protein [Ruminococcus sp.]|nr:helix-turn-helix domain-containing protein [Ruminococcus sp.]
MFYNRLEMLCLQKFGKKPQSLFKELGVSSGVISRWKQTGKTPDLSILLKLSSLFGVSLDYLVFGKDAENTLSPVETEMLCVFRKLSGAEQYKLIGRAQEIVEAAEIISKADVS